MSTFRSSHSPYTRRKFIYTLSAQFGMSLIAVKSMSASVDPDPAGSLSPEDQYPRKKLGVALVGLGKYSTGQLAPALQETRHCYLAGIVSGSPQKAEEWKKKYSITADNVYNYENFDKIKDNPAIDIVYVVLPNSMHAEYVIRAANAGKHVICEKPMALNTDECDRMISACKEAGKMFSIGYRLHFEPHHQRVMEMMRNKNGEIRKFTGEHGMSGAEGWRLDKSLAGGGPLMDVGIYCVQAARYSTGMEPIAVRAQEGRKSDPEKFSTIEESLSWQMEFPGGIIAECKTSYSEEMNLLRVDTKSEWVQLSPAYGYSGIEGKTNSGKMELPKVNQQARQMDDFALAIINKRPTPVPGEMGRQDVKILTAIYEAMRTGKRISIS